MDRLLLRLGLILLALAPMAWLAAAFADEAGDLAPAILLMVAGLALAAWGVGSERHWMGMIGFAAAAAGILWFYNGHLFAALGPMAGASFLAGCVLAAAGLAASSRRILATGLLVVAVASALWIYADAVSKAWIWEPGNVLACGGAALAGIAS